MWCGVSGGEGVGESEEKLGREGNKGKKGDKGSGIGWGSIGKGWGEVAI